MEGSSYFKTKFPQAIGKIIRASNINSYEDFSISEINKLHIFIMKSKRSELVNKCPKSKFFIESLLEQIKKQNNIFDYNSFDYKSWNKGFFTRHKEISYVEYLESKDQLHKYRLDYVNKQTKERQKKNTNKTKSNIVISHTIEDEFLDIANNHSWRKESPHYNGYSFDTKENSKLWTSLFNKYLTHRTDNGYETLKNQQRMFNFLMNYIFFYLNLWNMQNDNKINIPLSPKDFHRTLFFTNKKIKSVNENLPFTLIDFLNKKTESPSIKNAFIRELQSFFNFIIDFYEEENYIWNKNLNNPVKKIDQFREFKNKKTNKVIIPKSIYGKLKKYLFALEYFGEYLIEQSIKHRINVSNKSTENINTEDYGFVPVIFADNKTYPLFEIPNTYFYTRIRFFDENQLFGVKKNSHLVTKRRSLLIQL